MTCLQGEVILGDARNLDRFKDRFVRPPKAIITSPPYLDAQNYRVDGQIGFGQSEKQYLDDIGDVFKACMELSEDDAILWIVVGAIRRNGILIQLPEMVTQTATKAGWIAREQVTWAKGKSLPWSKKGEFRDVTEQAILLSKSDSYLFNLEGLLSPDPSSTWWRRYPERYSPNGRRPTNLWTIPIPTQGAWKDGPGHLCPFPHELTHRLISLGTDPGDVVLDPFAGVGSVPAMAMAMGRIGYGVELKEDYVDRFPLILERSHRWFEQKAHELADAQRRQFIFKETILRLRLLKFGRLIAKSMTSEKYPIKSVHVDLDSTEPTEPHKIIRGHFKISLDGRQNQSELLDYLTRLSRKRPLSKFGVQADFQICGVETVAPKYWYEDAKFWLEPQCEKPNETGTHLTADFQPQINDVVEILEDNFEVDFRDDGDDFEFFHQAESP